MSKRNNDNNSKPFLLDHSLCTIEGPLGRPLKREKEKELVKKINLRTFEKDN